MTTDAIIIDEVEWWATSADGQPYYRTCDFCYATACEDIWAGKAEKDWRTFHRQRGGVNDSLTACGHCLNELLSEPLE